MREYGFSVTRSLPYKDRIVDSVLYGKERVRENPYSRIFYAVSTGKHPSKKSIAVNCVRGQQQQKNYIHVFICCIRLVKSPSKSSDFIFAHFRKLIKLKRARF